MLIYRCDWCKRTKVKVYEVKVTDPWESSGAFQHICDNCLGQVEIKKEPNKEKAPW